MLAFDCRLGPTNDGGTMETKILEVRDRMTFIAVLTIKVTPANDAQRYYLRRSGWADSFDDVLLMRLDAQDGKVTADPFEQSGRTMHEAHQYIRREFDNLKDGDVVDVEFILGEQPAPKASEREAHPWGQL